MLKLNVGLARKIGEANYSSRGASVNLELEIESALVDEPRRLQERIRDLFEQVQVAVDAQLNVSSHAQASKSHQSNGHNGHRTRSATHSQCRALRAIADRQRLDLNELLHERFDVSRPEDLGIGQASAMIDHLRGKTNGTGVRR